MISEPVNLKRAVSREHWRRLGKPAIGNVDPAVPFNRWRVDPLSRGWLQKHAAPAEADGAVSLAVLFLSSLLFSWLDESRNYMPVVFVFAVIAAHALTQNPSARAERPGQLE